MNEEINTVSEEQVLHNKLSFEINQELIHLMKRIVELQQENARLKDKIERSFKIVDDKLTNLNLEYGINNEFREEYDELWEILKEK